MIATFHRWGRMAWLAGILLVQLGCTATPRLPGAAESSEAPAPSPLERLGRAVVDDYRQAYSADGLFQLVPHVAAHGLLANTNADRALRDHWQENWRSEPMDDFFHKFLRVGDYTQNRWSVPLYTLGMIAGGYSGTSGDNWFATWASRSLRANLVAGPQGWALTYALGTHRPTDGHSGWNPWNDNDGVSGHALYGAVPFLTAANMTDKPLARAGFYVASTLPALARINANKHYASQAYLGWALAYAAAARIAREETGEPGVNLVLLPLPQGGYAGLSVRF